MLDRRLLDKPETAIAVIARRGGERRSAPGRSKRRTGRRRDAGLLATRHPVTLRSGEALAVDATGQVALILEIN